MDLSMNNQRDFMVFIALIGGVDVFFGKIKIPTL